MVAGTRKAVEALWPLSQSYEYAAELGLLLRMALPGEWREWDSPALRERYPLPQALGFQFLVHLEEGGPERLLSLIPDLLAQGDRRLLLELQASVRCLGKAEESGEPGPLPDPASGQLGVVIPEACRHYPGRELLFGQWLDEALDGLETIPLPFDPASERQLARVHPPSYILGLDAMATRGGGLLSPETLIRSESPEAFRAAAGAMISAARESIRGGRPVLSAAAPGSHHAERARAGGTCLVNNLAVAAEECLLMPGVGRVAILDLDAHHGNGTEEIFLQRPEVLTISIHAAQPFFPGTGDPETIGEGRGRGFNMNLALHSEDSWADALEIARHRLEAFNPDLVLVELSLDAHAADPVSPLRAGDDAFRRAGEILSGLSSPLAIELGAATSRRAWVGGLRAFLHGLIEPDGYSSGSSASSGSIANPAASTSG